MIVLTLCLYNLLLSESFIPSIKILRLPYTSFLRPTWSSSSLHDATLEAPKIKNPSMEQHASSQVQSNHLILESTAAVVGTFLSLATISFLDMTTPVKFYAPSHAAIAITLMTIKSTEKLPRLWKVCLALGLSCAGSFSLVKLLGRGKLTRSLAAALALLVMNLTGSVHPSGGPFSVTFVDNFALKSHSWHYVFSPGISGTMVIFALVAIKRRIVTRLRLRKQFKS